VLVGLVCKVRWVVITFTVQTFALIVARLVAAAAGWHTLATLLRGPALVQASLVFVVWWLVITPGIHIALRHRPTDAWQFARWNCHPLLLVLHFLHLPAVGADFLGPGEVVPS
jgi:hypothetical protein